MPAARTPQADAAPQGATLYGMYILAIAAALVGNLFIRIGDRGGWLPPWAQVTLGIVSAAPLAAAAVMFWRLLRQDLDEMFQRVALEGMAFALVVFVPLAALYLNLRSAGAWTPRRGRLPPSPREWGEPAHSPERRPPVRDRRRWQGGADAAWTRRSPG